MQALLLNPTRYPGNGLDFIVGTLRQTRQDGTLNFEAEEERTYALARLVREQYHLGSFDLKYALILPSKPLPGTAQPFHDDAQVYFNTWVHREPLGSDQFAIETGEKSLDVNFERAVILRAGSWSFAELIEIFDAENCLSPLLRGISTSLNHNIKIQRKAGVVWAVKGSAARIWLINTESASEDCVFHRDSPEISQLPLSVPVCM